MSLFHTKWIAVKIVKSYKKSHYGTSKQIFEKSQIVFHEKDSLFSKKKKNQSVWRKNVTFPDLKYQISIASMYWEKQNMSVSRCVGDSDIDPFCMNLKDLLHCLIFCWHIVGQVFILHLWIRLPKSELVFKTHLVLQETSSVLAQAMRVCSTLCSGDTVSVPNCFIQHGHKFLAEMLWISLENLSKPQQSSRILYPASSGK